VPPDHPACNHGAICPLGLGLPKDASGTPAGPDYRSLRPLVLVGKVSLRGENRLTCFASLCGRIITAPDHAWFFRRRTRGGLGVVIYCDQCKSKSNFDAVAVYLYPDPPPAPVQPPSPSRFISAAENRNKNRPPPPPKPRIGIWRPEQEPRRP